MNATEWIYSGDVNCERGGAWFDLSNWKCGYVSAVRVTDLDGAVGFTGAVLIEHVVINGVTDAARIRNALRSCGCSARGMTKEQTRLMIADALASYGHTDPDGCEDETVQTDPSAPMSFDGWRATKRLHNTTVRDYVESVHLS